MPPRKPLQGRFQDLLTQGVPVVRKRWDVVKAVRQYMMSAQRLGHSYTDVHADLTDKRNKLAVQIVTGYKGRGISVTNRERFLEKHWRETEKLTSESPPWNADDVPEIIEMVRQSLEVSEVPDDERAVLRVVLDLADEYGTTTVAAPVHLVSQRTRIPYATAYRILMRLSARGEWLGLSTRGNQRTRRANTYNVAPALTKTYTPATPHMSQPIHMSHPHMSHDREQEMATGTLNLSDDEIAVILAMRAKAKDAARHVGHVAIGNEAEGNVTPINRAHRSSDHPAAASAAGSVATTRHKGETK